MAYIDRKMQIFFSFSILSFPLSVYPTADTKISTLRDRKRCIFCFLVKHWHSLKSLMGARSKVILLYNTYTLRSSVNIRLHCIWYYEVPWLGYFIMNYEPCVWLGSMIWRTLYVFVATWIHITLRGKRPCFFIWTYPNLDWLIRIYNA